MTIGQFENQCSVQTVPLERGYIVTVSWPETGDCVSAVGECVPKLVYDLKPQLARRVFRQR